MPKKISEKYILSAICMAIYAMSLPFFSPLWQKSKPSNCDKTCKISWQNSKTHFTEKGHTNFVRKKIVTKTIVTIIFFFLFKMSWVSEWVIFSKNFFCLDLFCHSIFVKFFSNNKLTHWHSRDVFRTAFHDTHNV